MFKSVYFRRILFIFCYLMLFYYDQGGFLITFHFKPQENTSEFFLDLAYYKTLRNIWRYLDPKGDQALLW